MNSWLKKKKEGEKASLTSSPVLPAVSYATTFTYAFYILNNNKYMKEVQR